jgi:hypothetical protein
MNTGMRPRVEWSSGVYGSAVAFLALLMLGLPGPATAAPAGSEEGVFTVARLQYGGGGDWYTNPTSLPNLLAGLRERTSIRSAESESRVRILDEDLFRHPFLYMTGHGTVRFTSAEADRLRKYLVAGGFLWADDCYGMDESFRREIRKVLPEAEIVELPFSHPIYHSFYDFPGGLPKIHEHDGKPPQGFGILHDGRLVVFYTYETDIGDGLEDPEVHQDPPEKREAALRMAINVVTYALTH